MLKVQFSYLVGSTHSRHGLFTRHHVPHTPPVYRWTPPPQCYVEIFNTCNYYIPSAYIVLHMLILISVKLKTHIAS